SSRDRRRVGRNRRRRKWHRRNDRRRRSPRGGRRWQRQRGHQRRDGGNRRRDGHRRHGRRGQPARVDREGHAPARPDGQDDRAARIVVDRHRIAVLVRRTERRRNHGPHGQGGGDRR